MTEVSSVAGRQGKKMTEVSSKAGRQGKKMTRVRSMAARQGKKMTEVSSMAGRQGKKMTEVSSKAGRQGKKRHIRVVVPVAVVALFPACTQPETHDDTKLRCVDGLLFGLLVRLLPGPHCELLLGFLRQYLRLTAADTREMVAARASIAFW